MSEENKSSPINLFISTAIAVVIGVVIGYFIFSKDNNTNNVVVQQTGNVVAKINGKPVYKSEVDLKLSEMIQGQEIDFSSLDGPIKEVVVKEIAAHRLILDEAYKKGFNNKSEVKQKLKTLEEGLIREEFLAELAKKSVTEDKIKQRYSKEIKSIEGKNQYKVSHILVKTEAEAKKVRDLVKIKKFGDVAKEKSIDKQTALVGGDVGYMVDGVMVPKFEQAVKTLKNGEISKPVQTRFGWHIIKLFDTKPVEAPEFEKVKANIAQRLYKEAINNYADKAIEDVKIELIEKEKKKEKLSDSKTEVEPSKDMAEAKTPNTNKK